MIARPLHAIVHSSRTFGYLLACLMLTQLTLGPMQLVGWLLLLLIYPPLIEEFIERSGGDHRAVMASMLIDSVLVGLLVSLTGFNLEASVVLVTLLGVSVLIVGGIRLLLISAPLLASGMMSGFLNHPAIASGGAGFYYVCFAALIAYIAFVGVQVYQETRRLKIETRRERGVRQSFEAVSRFCSPFVPPQLLDRMKAGGPKRKWLTVMFVDLHDFDAVADTASAETCRRLLHDYVDLIVDVVTREGGTVDKFIGQTAMVFVGDPVTRGVGADAIACVLMANEIRDGFDQLLAGWSGAETRRRPDTGSAVIRRLDLRIGIHTGFCLVGEIGGRRRRDYTAFGRAAALASRLKSAAEPGEILISAETLRHVIQKVRFSRRGCVYGPDGAFMLESFALLENRESRNAAVEVLPPDQHV